MMQDIRSVHWEKSTSHLIKRHAQASRCSQCQEVILSGGLGACQTGLVRSIKPVPQQGAGLALLGLYPFLKKSDRGSEPTCLVGKLQVSIASAH